jgi:hypothetical protein
MVAEGRDPVGPRPGRLRVSRKECEKKGPARCRRGLTLAVWDGGLLDHFEHHNGDHLVRDVEVGVDRLDVVLLQDVEELGSLTSLLAGLAIHRERATSVGGGSCPALSTASRGAPGRGHGGVLWASPG